MRSSTTIHTDEEWCVAIAARDPQIFQELGTQLFEWIYNYVRRQTGFSWPATAIEEFAADCTQDALIRILERIHQYQMRGPFLGWCRVIGLNLARDHLSNARFPIPSHESLDTESLADAQEMHHSVEASVLLSELADQIRHITENELSARQRAVFINIVQGRSTIEIATELDTTPNNVYQTWFAVRKKIRHLLESQGFDEAALIQMGLL